MTAIPGDGARLTALRKYGLSERAEQAFEVLSTGFVVLLGAAWAFAIGAARLSGDKVNLVTPATAAVVSELSTADAPTTAYVTDAVAGAVARLRAGDAGASGKLRALYRDPGPPAIVRAAAAVSGAVQSAASFAFITPRPASDVRRGRLGLYYIGNWPAPRSTKGGRVSYVPPSGFVEVTPANAGTRLSENFRLRDFLTHDQPNVWPKYEYVSLRLVDKLELVLADLRRTAGVDPAGVRVMSGFRTPQYNRSGGDPRGRADLSRHMYGDAADIYIDSDRDGRMDDLNRDGRADIGDARVILAAVSRVERAYPSLVGGAGVYPATSTHPAFVHIDTRGYAARWTGTRD